MCIRDSRLTELYFNLATPHCVVRIGVLFRAANNSREDVVFCGFFIAVVRSVMGDQAGGAEKLAVALTVRQLLFRSSTQLALGWRLLPLLEQSIMQNINAIPSAIRPFAAILSFEVPTTELDPDFVPSISLCVGEFERWPKQKLLAVLTLIIQPLSPCVPINPCLPMIMLVVVYE
jgi:hypothetical protein